MLLKIAIFMTIPWNILLSSVISGPIASLIVYKKKTTSKSNFITIWKKNDFKIYLQKIIGFYVTSTFSMSTLKLTFTTFASIYILIIGLHGVWFPELSQANSIFFNFITWRCKWLKICLIHYQENVHQLCCCDFQYYHI